MICRSKRGALWLEGKMRWKKTEDLKPCSRVLIKGSKVFECSPGWEVAEVYYDELDLDVDSITVRFTKTQEVCGGKEMSKKYIIELEDKVSENAKGEKLYFVKGFNNLSLDETALKKLTPYKESEHEFQVGDVVASWPKFYRGGKRIIVSTEGSSYALLGIENGIAYISKNELRENPSLMSWLGVNVSDKLEELFNE